MGLGIWGGGDVEVLVVGMMKGSGQEHVLWTSDDIQDRGYPCGGSVDGLAYHY